MRNQQATPPEGGKTETCALDDGGANGITRHVEAGFVVVSVEMFERIKRALDFGISIGGDGWLEQLTKLPDFVDGCKALRAEIDQGGAL